jgi:hypothetical protein
MGGLLALATLGSRAVTRHEMRLNSLQRVIDRCVHSSLPFGVSPSWRNL